MIPIIISYVTILILCLIHMYTSNKTGRRQFIQ